MKKQLTILALGFSELLKAAPSLSFEALKTTLLANQKTTIDDVSTFLEEMKTSIPIMVKYDPSQESQPSDETGDVFAQKVYDRVKTPTFMGMGVPIHEVTTLKLLHTPGN